MKVVLRITILWVFFIHSATAQDLARELQTGDEMARAQPDRVIPLEAGKQKFVALFNGAIPKQRRGGVILIHGPDNTPDARDVLKPLASRLPYRGWETLAIQAAMSEAAAPATEYQALIPLTLERIDSALQYLETRKSNPVVILGMGSGALATVRYLAEKPDAKIGAAVIVDIPMDSDQEAAVITDLEKNKKPLLDISRNTSRNLTPDKDMKRKRAQRENDDYRLLPLNDTSSSYKEVEDMLVNRIAGWLQRAVPSSDQPPAEPSGQAAPPTTQN